MQARVLKHVDTLIARYPGLEECRDSIIGAYEIMKEIMGDKLRYVHSGDEI